MLQRRALLTHLILRLHHLHVLGDVHLLLPLVLDEDRLIVVQELWVMLTPKVTEIKLSLVAGIDIHLRHLITWWLEDVNQSFLLVGLQHLLLKSLSHNVGFH